MRIFKFKGFWVMAVGIASIAIANAQVFINNQPRPDGGTFRQSQLWIDPGPDGNDLDSDAMAYAGFVLGQESTIRRVDWWGRGASDVGFHIEFWQQDPNTIAYQPMGIWRYTGTNPEARITTAAYNVETFGSFNHYWVDLPTPVTLAANSGANTRWFLSVIGLTHTPFATWNWAQSPTGMGTFGYLHGINRTYVSGDSRAFKLTGNPVPEPATIASLSLIASLIIRKRHR